MRLPQGRPTTRPSELFSVCDAPPDSGQWGHLSGQCWARRRPAEGYARPSRRGRPTKATHSLSQRSSLQPLPRLTCREAGEPPGDTRTLSCQGGPPQNQQPGGKHNSGGRLRRRRDKTTDATQRQRYRPGVGGTRCQRNATLTDATQRNATRTGKGTRTKAICC